jgi:hypothetical protein
LTVQVIDSDRSCLKNQIDRKLHDFNTLQHNLKISTIQKSTQSSHTKLNDTSLQKQSRIH